MESLIRETKKAAQVIKCKLTAEEAAKLIPALKQALLGVIDVKDVRIDLIVDWDDL